MHEAVEFGNGVLAGFFGGAFAVMALWFIDRNRAARRGRYIRDYFEMKRFRSRHHLGDDTLTWKDCLDYVDRRESGEDA